MLSPFFLITLNVFFFLKCLSPVCLWIIFCIFIFRTILLIWSFLLIFKLPELLILFLSSFFVFLNETLSPLIFCFLFGHLTLFIFFSSCYWDSPSRGSPIRCITLFCLSKIIKPFIFTILLSPDSPEWLVLVRCGIISGSILEGPIVITHILNNNIN